MITDKELDAIMEEHEAGQPSYVDVDGVIPRLVGEIRRLHEVAEIPDDEPFFVLRANNRYTLGLVRRYVNLLHQAYAKNRVPFQTLVAAMDREDEIHGWQTRNPSKVQYPD